LIQPLTSLDLLIELDPFFYPPKYALWIVGLEITS